MDDHRPERCRSLASTSDCLAPRALAGRRPHGDRRPTHASISFSCRSTILCTTKRLPRWSASSASSTSPLSSAASSSTRSSSVSGSRRWGSLGMPRRSACRVGVRCPHEQQLALLGGLVDSDGWAERGGKSLSIELANPALLEDVKSTSRSAAASTPTACSRHASGRRRSEMGVRSRRRRRALRIQGDLARRRGAGSGQRGLAAGRFDGGRRTQAATGLNFSRRSSATRSASRCSVRSRGSGPKSRPTTSR